MSPIPHIDDYKEKKESFASWYLLAGILGVAIFVVLLISSKVVVFTVKLIVKFALEHGVYFGIGILLLLIFIKKLKKSRRLREIKESGDSYR